MVPGWLTVVSCVSLAVAFLCAGIILYDILVRGYRQHMWIMEAVWPLTSLYFGPLALWVYCRWGRPQSEVSKRLCDARESLYASNLKQ